MELPERTDIELALAPLKINIQILTLDKSKPDAEVEEKEVLGNLAREIPVTSKFFGRKY